MLASARDRIISQKDLPRSCWAGVYELAHQLLVTYAKQTFRSEMVPLIARTGISRSIRQISTEFFADLLNSGRIFELTKSHQRLPAAWDTRSTRINDRLSANDESSCFFMLRPSRFTKAGIGGPRELSVQSKTILSSERSNVRELLMRIRLGLAVLWTLVILVLCWTPADWLPVKETEGQGWDLPHKDKFVHAGMFLVFAVLWLEATRGKPGRFAWVAWRGSLLPSLPSWVRTSRS